MTSLTEDDVAGRVHELEARFGLYQYLVDGHSAWRILRFRVALEMRNVSFNRNLAQPTWGWLKDRVSLFLPEIPKMIFVRPAHLVVFAPSSELREKEGRYFKDGKFDDLLLEVKDSLKIERLNTPLDQKRRRMALVPAAFTTATIDLIAGLFIFLGLPRRLRTIADFIARDLSTEPSLHAFTGRRIVRTLRRFYWTKRFYRWLFMRIKPAFVLTANTGEFAIWAAAQALGITTVDFQHGVFTHSHPDTISRDVMDGPADFIIPKMMLLYGDYWLTELKKMHDVGAKLVPVGHHQIDRFRKIRLARIQDLRTEQQCRVLLTTQGVDQANLIIFMSKVLALAQGRMNLSLVIKLHPVYDPDKSVYERAFNQDARVRILKGTEGPSTFSLLAQSHFHVSISSATHFDALGIGVPTIVLPLAGHDVTMQLVEAGHASLAHTPEEFLDILKEYRRASIPLAVSTYYFKPNAIDNIMQALGIQP